VLVTVPYFHDGSQETLWDVVDHYNKGAGLQNPYLDVDIQPLALTEGDIDDLVAFMAALTSPDYKGLGIRELARQRELSRTNRPQRDTARAFGPKPVQPSLAPLVRPISFRPEAARPKFALTLRAPRDLLSRGRHTGRFIRRRQRTGCRLGLRVPRRSLGRQCLEFTLRQPVGMS
jgi:hypothetical protein